jgi:hypothetical protein
MLLNCGQPPTDHLQTGRLLHNYIEEFHNQADSEWTVIKGSPRPPPQAPDCLLAARVSRLGLAAYKINVDFQLLQIGIHVEIVVFEMIRLLVESSNFLNPIES